jgi:predicted kinase
MSEVVILVGLQGAGKTTFFRQRFAETHDHVSKDRFRNNRNKARRQRQLIEEALRAGRSVVVDNTNATRQDRKEIVEVGRAFGAKVVCCFFESDVAGSVERNRRRTGKAHVPDAAIYVTRHRLQEPDADEGFDELYRVRALENFRFEINNGARQ